MIVDWLFVLDFLIIFLTDPIVLSNIFESMRVLSDLKIVEYFISVLLLSLIELYIGLECVLSFVIEELRSLF